MNKWGEKVTSCQPLAFLRRSEMSWFGLYLTTKWKCWQNHTWKFPFKMTFWRGAKIFSLQTVRESYQKILILLEAKFSSFFLPNIRQISSPCRIFLWKSVFFTCLYHEYFILLFFCTFGTKKIKSGVGKTFSLYFFSLNKSDFLTWNKCNKREPKVSSLRLFPRDENCVFDQYNFLNKSYIYEI